MSPLSFIGLPAEVRNLIYERLFAGALIEDRGFAPNPISTSNYHLCITATNRLIRAESLSVLQAATTLHFRIGQAGPPPIPPTVLHEIRTIRIPAHRLRTLDTPYFVKLSTLVLDVTVEPALWRMYRKHRNNGISSPTDVSDMIHLSMALGLFDHSWDVEKIWRDKERQFRILCWLRPLPKDAATTVSALIDIDRGIVLEESH